MKSSDAFDGLQPAGLWAHFDRITRIARPSGQEAAIRQYIETWAGRHGFPAQRDAAGNLSVRVPPSPGAAPESPLALQAHLDMVCVREEASPSDPARGEIQVVRDREWIKAEGSTLGADNGIAIAAMLHLAEAAGLRHGPMDLLFTVEEETTSSGADSLDPSLLRANILLNLDSEEEGVVVAGSAGGIWTKLRWSSPLHSVPDDWRTVEVAIAGLQGGHSGIDISKHRLNAICGLLRILQKVAEGLPLRLGAVEGGDAFNAIPRLASAAVCYPAAEQAGFNEAISSAREELTDEFLESEPGLSFRVTSSSALPQVCHSLEDSRRLLDMLSVLPNGVLGMDRRIPDLVETSCNLGVVAREGDHLVVQSFSRSSVTPALHAVVAAIAAAARLGSAEFSVVPPEGPCWELDPSSRALALVREAFRRLFGKEPALQTVHAFLECSLIKKQNPVLDIVSLGPEIRDAHRPGERVHIGSVGRFFRLLSEVVSDHAGETKPVALNGNPHVGARDLH